MKTLMIGNAVLDVDSILHAWYCAETSCTKITFRSNENLHIHYSEGGLWVSRCVAIIKRLPWEGVYKISKRSSLEWVLQYINSWGCRIDVATTESGNKELPLDLDGLKPKVFNTYKTCGFKSHSWFLMRDGSVKCSREDKEDIDRDISEGKLLSVLPYNGKFVIVN